MLTSIFWNCRGLGNPSTVNSLNELVRKYSSNILFLCETKCMMSDLMRIKGRLKFDHVEGVEASGKSGGLALFWNDELSLVVRNKNSHVIDTMI